MISFVAVKKRMFDTSSPVSSRTSRSAQPGIDSLNSRWPPGKPQCPVYRSALVDAIRRWDFINLRHDCLSFDLVQILVSH